MVKHEESVHMSSKMVDTIHEVEVSTVLIRSCVLPKCVQTTKKKLNYPMKVDAN